MAQDRSPLGNNRPALILEPGVQSCLTLQPHHPWFRGPCLCAALTAFRNFTWSHSKGLDKMFLSSAKRGHTVTASDQRRIPSLQENNLAPPHPKELPRSEIRVSLTVSPENLFKVGLESDRKRTFLQKPMETGSGLE